MGWGSEEKISKIDLIVKTNYVVAYSASFVCMSECSWKIRDH